jgi:pimeloyl-ACP methyl ester carboxylesterase
LFSKIGVPVLALGGELGLGKMVKPMVEGVAGHVQGEVVSNCGHFIQEEQPEHLLKLISEFMATVNS